MEVDQCLPGTRVRLIRSPDRTGGVLPGEPRKRGDTWTVQVHFDTGSSTWTRVENLEPVVVADDPFSEAASGSFHPASTLRRQLLHEKLHGRLSNLLYSMDTSDTEFFAYQFKPVFKLIESPTNGILIADEVGLGKTIESGLVWTELRARAGARNLLVVCPPALRLKWQAEFARRFGVRARIVKAKELEAELVQWKSDRGHSFALIASYHSLRPKKGWREENPNGHRDSKVRLAHLLMELATAPDPPVDLLAMDEVHHMRNPETATAGLGELLCPIAAHRIFLSATPIHTANENLYSLLKLLDPDTYTNVETFRSILAANAPLVALRDAILSGGVSREDLIGRIDSALDNPMLRDSQTLGQVRRQIGEAEDLADPGVRSRLAYQLERSNLLGSTVTRSRKKDVFEKVVERKPKTRVVELHPLEIDLYRTVSGIVEEYASRANIPGGFLGVMPQRQIASCAAAALARWSTTQPAITAVGETEDDLPPSSGRPLIDFLRHRLPRSFTPEALEKVDTKYGELLHFFQDYWRKNPDRKVVLFAYFKPTLHYLQRRLAADGIPALLLEGGAGRRGEDPSESKQAIIDEFRKSDSVRLLLSSEVGGEGLDMQFASTVINYDLPWNPMVVEQRIGRIDRIGQDAEMIYIYNFVAGGTVDEEIWRRLYKRLKLFTRALGDLGDVLGPLVTELQRDLLNHKLSKAQQQARIDAAERAIAERLRQHEEMETNAGVLAAYGDYILDQINSRHDRQQWITASDIETFLTEFFRTEFPETRLQGIDPAKRLYEFDPDGDAAYEIGKFLERENLQGQTRLASRRRHNIRFEHRTYTPVSAGLEVIHQSHPLVRFACGWLRRERKLTASPAALSLPLSELPDGFQPGLYAYVVQRWTVEGLRVDERLSYHALQVESGDAVPADMAEQLIEAAARATDWRAANADLGGDKCHALAEILEGMDTQAGEAFGEFEERCQNENNDRARIQLNAILRYRERREGVLREVVAKHRANGRPNLIAATEGLIRDHLAQCEARERKVKEKAEIEGGYELIATGVIRVGK